GGAGRVATLPAVPRELPAHQDRLGRGRAGPARRIPQAPAVLRRDDGEEQALWHGPLVRRSRRPPTPRTRGSGLGAVRAADRQPARGLGERREAVALVELVRV